MINRKKCIDKMADRIPLIVNASAKQIQELPNQDDLVLSGQLKMTGTSAGASDINLSGGNDAKSVITVTETSSNLSQLSVDCRNNADNADLNVADFKVGTSDKIELVVKGDVTATNFIKADGTPIATNAPTFKALLNADQQITATTGNIVNSQKIQFGTEEFDSDGCFNNTNSNATLNGITVPSYSFAPNVAGFYFVSASASPRHTVVPSAALVTFSHIKIFKNNVLIASCVSDTSESAADNENTQTASTIIQMNGTSDTIHVETAVRTDGGQNDAQLKIIKNDVTNYFFAYKLIT